MFSRKFVEQIRFWSSLGRSGSSGKSTATRCQNSSLLQRLPTPKHQKNDLETIRFKIFWTFTFAINFICNSFEKLEIKMKLTQMLLLLLELLLLVDLLLLELLLLLLLLYVFIT